MATAITSVPQIAIAGAPGSKAASKFSLRLRRAVNRLFDPYRPEMHYMRGPGPKWHAKHDRNLNS